jgi:putative intracellular protease/amidase
MSEIAYLYVFDTMSDWEPAFLIAELRTGRYFKHNRAPYEVKAVALNDEPVLTMGGLRIMPDCTLKDCHPDNSDLLILPGGDTWLQPFHSGILAKAEEFLAAGLVVAGICGATIGLAQAGILNNRCHTSNDLNYLKAVSNNYTGEDKYCQKLAVTDGGLVTASGIAPIEFSYEVLKVLDVFETSTLEAWYQLYKTGEAKYYLAIMESIGRM